MRAVIVCPDRHLVYDARTPEETGVGGGVTVRVRAAAALAKRGVEVSLICNCLNPSEWDGVRYIPLDAVPPIEADILLLHSSGGAVDVSPGLALGVKSQVRLVMASGVTRLKGIPEVDPHAIYLPSNFLRRYATKNWELAAEKTFVTYHGVSRPAIDAPRPPRNPHRLLYPSHPAKGLDAALGVWRRLRSVDARFELEICGGDRLWGGTVERFPPAEPGLIYSGLMGQRALYERFQQAAFVVQLQEVQEGFGISVAEGMAAGCIVLASPVGAYAETIRDSFNGFLIEGPHLNAETQDQAAQLILNLIANPSTADPVRRNAALSPLDWDDVAATWIGHWEWLLGAKKSAPGTARCSACGGHALILADGSHCTQCGNYDPNRFASK